ncbi:UBP-type zinc finger domain-containing protein [Thiocapsa sp.]|uniref:UBP-type zinc finger domain-containing protein n=1 Tax=Thiocapsa sp. TaxID=2024551 RepID=UPI003592EA79
MPSQASCAHLRALTAITPANGHVCEECIKTDATRVHLRTFQTCGATLCCDSSPNRHATRHARVSAHSEITSAEPGEHWLYCYPDDAYAEY